MDYAIGQEIKPVNEVAVGKSPGQQSFNYGRVSSNAPAKIIGQRNVGGEVYLNIDQTSLGGGTGWLKASDIQDGGGSGVNNTGNSTVNNNSSNMSESDFMRVNPSGFKEGGVLYKDQADFDARNRPTKQTTTATTNDVPTFKGIPTLDITKVYNESMKSPEILEAQTKITETDNKINERRTALAQAEALINDNPFYSEATRVGRISKLNEKAQADIDNLLNEKTTYENNLSNIKADANTRVNMALKQYDINNQDYQNRLNEFNILMQTGALAGLSGDSISALAESTGFDTKTILAIQKQLNKVDVKPQLVQNTDDNGNVTLTVVDINTGKIISTSSLGKVDKAKTVASPKETSDSVYGKLSDKYYQDAIDILAEEELKGQEKHAKVDIVSGEKEKVKGDKLVSQTEFESAYSRVLGLVGSEDEADKLMDRAWSTGGYQRWKW